VKPQFLFLGALLSFAALLGCAGGTQSEFILEVVPSTITVVPGGAQQTLSVGVSEVTGIRGSITVTVGSLPAGVTATPASLSLPPASLGQFSISASSTAIPGTANFALTGTSGGVIHAATISLKIASPVTTASLSTTSFDFGDNLVNNTLTQTVVVVTNTGSVPLDLNPSLSGDPSYSIASSTSCNQQLPAAANCNMVLNYAPTAPSAPATQDAILNMGFGDVPAGTPQTVTITGIAAALPVGQVTATNNPQVALYTMTLPFPGSVTVNFGQDTNYGLKTWTQSTATAGGVVSVFVAGMLASTTYHMQAAVEFSNGITANDTDHVFTTNALPASLQLNVTTTTTPGMTPQSGLELLTSVAGTPTAVIVTDLSGNEVWTYADPGNPTLVAANGAKVLPDGNFLIEIGAPTS